MEEWKLGNETDDANMVIDQKLRQYFDGRIVRKDLTKSIKEGANVPVYVLEFLLGQYCSSDDDEVIEKEGIENDPILLLNFSCHTLRHTFATRLCESGINVKVIQDVLGHADISTTMDIYVDVMDELKKREIASFDSYMAKSRETI